MSKLNTTYIDADTYNAIICVLTEASKRYEYKPDTGQNVVVFDEDGNVFASISMDKFIEESKSLLTAIKESNEPAIKTSKNEYFYGANWLD